MKQALFLLVFFAPLTFAQDMEQFYDLPFGEKLTLKQEVGGNLEVMGWDQPNVKITYRLSASNEAFTLEPEQREEGLVLIGSSPMLNKRDDLSVKLKIWVPNRADLDLYTTGGHLSIQDVQGDILAKTMGGNTSMENLIGHLELTTYGGNVNVSSSELTGFAKTYGGNINFENSLGTLQADTMGGNINLDNSGTMDTNLELSELKLKTMGGNVVIGEAPLGVAAKTMGGNIKVDYAGEFAELETMGGAIIINELDGWATAKTMGGRIFVNMVGDANMGRRDLDLSSQGGSIEIRVPADLSMAFDVEIEVTEDARRDYQIISDFNVDARISDSDRRAKNRNAGHKVVGTGAVAGGQNVIKVRTVNGDVKIIRN